MLDTPSASPEEIGWLSLQMRMALGITKKQQQEECITSASRWGDVETIAARLRRHWLEWVGYVARILITVCLGFACLDGYLKCDHFMDPREDGGTL